jgi:hypothetical protein
VTAWGCSRTIGHAALLHFDGAENMCLRKHPGGVRGQTPRDRFHPAAPWRGVTASATKRNLVTPRCLLPGSKQTLDAAYSEQFCNVAPCSGDASGSCLGVVEGEAEDSN